MIEVVLGVIIQAGRILLTQRQADQDFPFTWESPGGKVEGLHESNHNALRRVLRKEIGIEAGVISEHALWCGHFKNATKRVDRQEVFVLFYQVFDWVGTPIPLEGQGIGWFSDHEFDDGLELSEANYRAYKEIIEALRRSNYNK